MTGTINRPGNLETMYENRKNINERGMIIEYDDKCRTIMIKLSDETVKTMTWSTFKSNWRKATEEIAEEVKVEVEEVKTETEEVKTASQTLQQSVKNLEELFDIFNEKLFNNELERPIISIQQDHKKSSYGWCTTYKAWQSTSGEEYYEINLCAEHMTRSLYEICSTLLHEMSHLYNIMHEITDCNASQYHNKKFKEAAEAHGLMVEKTKHGWSKTTLNAEMVDFVSTLSYTFDIARKDAVKIKKIATKKKYHAYKCPCCDIKLYGVKEMNLTCNDCNEQMIEY